MRTMNFELYKTIQVFYDICDTLEEAVFSELFADQNISFRDACKVELLGFSCMILSKGSGINEEGIRCLNYYFDKNIESSDRYAIRSQVLPAAEGIMRTSDSGSFVVDLIVKAENYVLKNNYPLPNSAIDVYVDILYALGKEFMSCDGDVSFSRLEAVSAYIVKIKEYVKEHHLKKGMIKCLR